MTIRPADLSPRALVLAFTVVGLLIVAAAWQVILGPARAGLASRAVQLASLRKDVVRAQAVAARLPEVQREVRAIEVSLEEPAAAPAGDEDPRAVLRTLHELASQSALDLTSFIPRAATAKPADGAWSVELGLAGGYHGLGQFFARAGGLTHLVSVEDLQIKRHPQPTERHVIAATCLATFMFKNRGTSGGAK